jgi:D-alanyl-D-alanine carboxypeptidase
MYPGDTITVIEAILSLIVHSANDAAVVVAENIAGTEDKFADLMTRRARQLGMKSTTFKNASGLHNPSQVTTAKDMALLGIALKRHFSDYYYLFSRTYFSYNGRTYNGHNRVTRDYEGADGLKTGYVRASGFNLVTSASRSEGSLVGVVLGGRSAATRDQRMKDMLDASFERLEQIKRSGKYQVNNDNTKILFQEFAQDESADSQERPKELALNNQGLEPASGAFVPYPKEKPKFLAQIN